MGKQGPTADAGWSGAAGTSPGRRISSRRCCSRSRRWRCSRSLISSSGAGAACAAATTIDASNPHSHAHTLLRNPFHKTYCNPAPGICFTKAGHYSGASIDDQLLIMDIRQRFHGWIGALVLSAFYLPAVAKNAETCAVDVQESPVESAFIEQAIVTLAGTPESEHARRNALFTQLKAAPENPAPAEQALVDRMYIVLAASWLSEQQTDKAVQWFLRIAAQRPENLDALNGLLAAAHTLAES